MAISNLDSLTKYFMNRFLRQAAAVTTLLMSIAGAGSLWAQDKAETALQEASSIIETEQEQANTDLRESVHENLETIQEDAKTKERSESGTRRAAIGAGTTTLRNS